MTSQWSFVGRCLLMCLVLFYGTGAQAADPCPAPVATLVSLQGPAQVQRQGVGMWQDVAMEERFCAGDMLRVGNGARAAVVLANEAVLRLNQKSTIHFPPALEQRPFLLELLEGMLHIFSHRPRALEIVTPYVNGSVEGTEFLVQVEPGRALITVFEGIVVAANRQGRLELASGERAVAETGQAPVSAAVIQPRDAVAWTLYYPMISTPAEGPAGDGAAQAVQAAAAELAVGQVRAARNRLERLQRDDPDNSEALALLSIIETVGNNKEEALDLARRALAGDPASAAARLALSYAQQAIFDLESARSTLEQGAAANPDNGLIQARLAEMYLSFGDYDKALATAQKAVAVAPDLGRAQTVLGFVYVSRLETEQARETFSQAIRLNSALPLARLGLGLATIRTGELATGRGELEIAAALDPGNALIRSYLGKAYYDEKRDRKAGRQYEVAKRLDPADPTPWFYDAVRKQTENRPVEALHDLQQSMARNDNRAVYRSRLLLDDDLAARSAGLGRIYNDLGFSQLARVQGWRSLTHDPANYSAHRFLADIYRPLPYHEVARVSELLQSQLLQPINITPVQPQLAQSELEIIDGGGPSTAAFNEFNPLFLRDDIFLRASGVAGSNDILGDELVLSGIHGGLSYSIGQFFYQSDGFRDNNDQQQEIYNAFIQGMVSPHTSWLAEVSYSDKDNGDLDLKFDPTDFSSTLRGTDLAKYLRIGGRHDLGPNSTLLATAAVGVDENGESTGTDGFFLAADIETDVDSQVIEVQHLWRCQRFNLVSGVGYLHGDETITTEITSPFTSFSEEEDTTEHFNIYAYANIEFTPELTATAGLSGDLLESPLQERDELNPKFGLQWQPLPETTIRAAVLKNVMRRFIHAQTIEPTMIAGFNQYFNDSEAADYWLYGLGLDQAFSAELYGGIQYYHRDLDIPYLSLDPVSGQALTAEDDWEEDIGSAYLYWVVSDWFVLGLEYYYERFIQDTLPAHGALNVTTHRVVPALSFFHPSGFRAKLATSYIHQEGEFFSSQPAVYEDEDQFWVVDLSLGYRLPRRYGTVELTIKNLFDEQFHYVDTDPASPRYLPEQQIIASITVAF